MLKWGGRMRLQPLSQPPSREGKRQRRRRQRSSRRRGSRRLPLPARTDQKIMSACIDADSICQPIHPIICPWICPSASAVVSVPEPFLPARDCCCCSELGDIRQMRMRLFVQRLWAARPGAASDAAPGKGRPRSAGAGRRVVLIFGAGLALPQQAAADAIKSTAAGLRAAPSECRGMCAQHETIGRGADELETGGAEMIRPTRPCGSPHMMA